MKKTSILLIFALLITLLAGCYSQDVNTVSTTAEQKTVESEIYDTDSEVLESTIGILQAEITQNETIATNNQDRVSSVNGTTNDLSEETKIEIVSNDIAVVTTMEESTAIEATEETTFEETTAIETTESGNLITEIRQAFWEKRTLRTEGMVLDENEYPHFWYYGEYGVGHIVLIETVLVSPMFQDETVAGITFHYFNFDDRLELYYSGEFYSLGDAYEKNLISFDDLTRLLAQFEEYPYNVNHKLQPGDYYLVPEYSKSVDVVEDVKSETTVVETAELQKTEEETTATETTEIGNLITEIRQAFWEKRTLYTERMVLDKNEYPHFWYYGEYGVGHIVLIETVIETMFQDETVAGITFHYINYNDRLYLYYSGEFYLLGDAYEKNLMSLDDLTRLHAQFVEYRYTTSYGLQPGNYYIVPGYLKSVEDIATETTSKETTEIETISIVEELRKTFWKTRTLNFGGMVFDENEYPHFWYYGEYGVGHVVLYQPSYYEPAEYDETIAGLTFHFFNYNEKLDFYCDGELYSLKDAYEKNMITLEDLTKLNNYFSSHPYYKDKAIYH